MIVLPKIKIGKKEFFIDQRIGELRNIINPHDRIGCEFPFSHDPRMVCTINDIITLRNPKVVGSRFYTGIPFKVDADYLNVTPEGKIQIVGKMHNSSFLKQTFTVPDDYEVV